MQLHFLTHFFPNALQQEGKIPHRLWPSHPIPGQHHLGAFLDVRSGLLTALNTSTHAKTTGSVVAQGWITVPCWLCLQGIGDRLGRQHRVSHSQPHGLKLGDTIVASMLSRGCSQDGAIPNIPIIFPPAKKAWVATGVILLCVIWNHILVPPVRRSSEVQEERGIPEDKSMSCSQTGV